MMSGQISALRAQNTRGQHGSTDFQLGARPMRAKMKGMAALTEPGTAPETLRRMLQDLLADRFGVAVHAGTRSVAGYRLVRG